MMRGSRSASLSAQRGIELRERGVPHRSTLFFYFIRSKAGGGALASAFGTLVGNGAGIPDVDDEHGDIV
jgi:hypothetical protein